MKKLMLALVALFAVVATGLEARCGRGSCGTRVETIAEGCAPKCFQWRKVSVCPLKRIVYECPEGSNYGDTACTQTEMINGGAANY